MLGLIKRQEIRFRMLRIRNTRKGLVSNQAPSNELQNLNQIFLFLAVVQIVNLLTT